jgi:hypothetical protein
MSDKPKKQAKKAAKKQATEKSEILYSCVVVKDFAKIGSMTCLKGTKANLPEDKAKALEALEMIKIEGVA